MLKCISVFPEPLIKKIFPSTIM